MNNDNDSYENIFAEWEIKPLNKETDNYFQNQQEDQEEEIFPTSSVVNPKIEEVKTEPVKLGTPVDDKKPQRKPMKEMPPLPPGIEKMMGSLLKMFGGELGMNGNEKGGSVVGEEVEDDSISKIELKALGCLLKIFASTILNIFGWLMDQLRDRVPLGLAFDSVQKIIADDIERGMWNDMFNTPDEFLEYQFHPVIYNIIDQTFGFLYFMIDNNRIFIPVITFLLGCWMAA